MRGSQTRTCARTNYDPAPSGGTLCAQPRKSLEKNDETGLPPSIAFPPDVPAGMPPSLREIPVALAAATAPAGGKDGVAFAAGRTSTTLACALRLKKPLRRSGRAGQHWKT